MRKLLAALVLSLLGVLAQAQTQNVPKTILWQYNLNQTVSPQYCALGPLLPAISARITAANSTTVTAVSGTPFLNVSVGAMLHFVDINGTDYRRTVTVRNSDTSVVVSGAAITVTSAQIQNDSANITCTTSQTSSVGAFSIVGFSKWGVQVDIGQQVNTGGLSFHLQCRTTDAGQWVQVYPELTIPTMTLSYTSAITSTGRFSLETQSIYTSCRVGMFIVTSDDGNDLTTNAEQVTIQLIGRP